MANAARIVVEFLVPKPTSPHQFKVGDKIKAKIAGEVVDVTIRAVVDHTDGLKLQVDFGYEQTAFVRFVASRAGLTALTRRGSLAECRAGCPA